MAIRFRSVFWLFAIVVATTPKQVAHAQTGSVEFDLTAGYSSEVIRAAATQVRAFGELGPRSKIQYFGEVAWGERWSHSTSPYGTLLGIDAIPSDAFGAAYPYQNKLQVTEAYAERTFRPRGSMMTRLGCGPATRRTVSSGSSAMMVPMPTTTASTHDRSRCK